MRFLYLHGFASSPQSQKARAFHRALASAGVSLEVPNLVPGDFSGITITNQLEVIEDTLHSEPCRLIGSSMGGYLASLYAATHPEVDRLVLLAPAFEFATRWRQIQGPEAIRQWKETNALAVYHYGEREFRQIRYQLFEDAIQHPAAPNFQQPALIFHGLGDAVVPIDYSRRFAASHPNAVLCELPSDHELLGVLHPITAAAVPFLTQLL